MSLVQVAVGDVIAVLALPQLLNEDGSVEAPSLRHWLQSSKYPKVTQACASDAKILEAEHGITMANVFDTAIADLVLRGDTNMRKLDILLHEYVGQPLMFKGALDHTAWYKRPLRPHQVVYAWQDVAYGEALYHAMTERLRDRRLKAMADELSRHLVERDGSRVPDTVRAAALVVRTGDQVWLTRPRTRLVELVSSTTTQGGVRVAVGAARPRLPVIRF